MNTIKISKSEVQGPFVTPPECGGQTVEHSYACTDEYIIERVLDRSDKTEVYVAYKYRGECQPQNGVPSLGRRVGVVKFVA